MLAADRVRALAALALCGFDCEPHLLAQVAADEATDRMRLPTCRLHDFGAAITTPPSPGMHDSPQKPMRSSQSYRAVTIAALIESLFSTFDTPGADHATLSAAFRSAQLETAPVRTTVDPRIST